MRNKILELRGKAFEQQNKTNSGFALATMKPRSTLTTQFFNEIIDKLSKILDFWQSETRPFKNILINVFYNKIVAKSNRISTLLTGVNSSSSIVGAKFNDSKTKHIITYCISIEKLVQNLEDIKNVVLILTKEFNNVINEAIFKDNTYIEKINFEQYSISKSKFKGIVADLSYIDDFDIPSSKINIQSSVVSLYKTDVDAKIILKELGINLISSKFLDENTVYLTNEEMNILFDKAPYLILMSVKDQLKLPIIEVNKQKNTDDSVQTFRIKDPENEPVIGVIDTLFDKNVYFSKWVEYIEMIDDNIPKSPQDYVHGTLVSSIIVDGCTFNPKLDDGCGNFRVKHFGVALSRGFSSFSLIKKIKTIVAQNLEIKVWNLCLGSSEEINQNFISVVGATLDEIQYEYDVIFIIAGTNKTTNSNSERIGSPADSINSIVVNSVDMNRVSADYTRKGLALSFFSKPDVSYYGGTNEEPIRTCGPLGEYLKCGTSFAAPWISRKVAYLIHILGLSKELAKALIIDSAREWNSDISPEQIALTGHGVVPLKISDIIKTKQDEIKFFVQDVSEKWNTYNYFFPIPLNSKNNYPFFVRLTMCYFPKCSRLQGVDYTNTELNVHFGRISDKNKIIDIKNDKQNQDEEFLDSDVRLLEGTAREHFRKWDNVKYIVEKISNRKKAKISFSNKNWGMEIKTNNRLHYEDGVGLKFGVIVTLKEINGKNRIDEFIRNCQLNGWIVNKIDVEQKIKINQKMEQEIELI
ncbi:S8 family peptidase [Mycoplasmopsis phocirhinis]|uniref:S8 family peptidase n=1 Tax=Mycoplasmopsis phocirhinis TaxID=142650 RepID=A0A4P6MTF9_9BACT|nr:S8 family peptidase [Mycoplasmopsis phocirhinis]QBF34627.1 S8 family peptidase [Mycoplasmopsis phocirhinis]